MTTKQEEELKAAVLAELLEIASDQLRSSLEISKKIWNMNITAGQPHKTPLGKVAILEKRIASIGENPQKWFRNADVYQLDELEENRCGCFLQPCWL